MTVPIGDPDPIGQLVELSRTLGRPERDLVVLAEGNTSVRTTGNRMLVKASGSVMAAAGPGDFVEVDT
ncbi:MAG: class II aldolase/adducin family protein, partial [Micromonosporaceae bacterium]